MGTKAFLKTPLGVACIQGSSTGVTSITIQDQMEEEIRSQSVSEDLKIPVEQLKEYFEGKRNHFTFNLNPSGTEFQRKVWSVLLQIPFGKTSSYLDIAKKLGDPKCIRAAARANGKNPLWIVVPCHRVIGSNGELTGYAGGLWRKKWLLEHESPVKQQQLF